VHIVTSSALWAQGARALQRSIMVSLAIAASLVMGFAIAGNTSHGVASRSHQTVADICGGASGLPC
jgi:hypothetical protein